MNPIPPKTMVTMSIKIDVDDTPTTTNVRMTSAAIMAMPPMVGVPAFF